MDWLTEEAFGTALHAPGVHPNASLDDNIIIKTSESGWHARLPLPPTVGNDRDGLGPTLRWFAHSKDVLLVFTVHVLRSPTQATVSTPSYQAMGKQSPWQVIDPLDAPVFGFVAGIDWIRGLLAASPGSVYRRDNHGIAWEVYRLATSAEAQPLLDALSARYPAEHYFPGPSENLNATWLLLRQPPGCPASAIGAYRCRAAAEDLAREFSLRDDALYSTRTDDDATHGLAFRRGQACGGPPPDHASGH